ncbi:acetyl-CoA carboxylase biotin carboxyl carrier protein [Neobacillus sp. Marseille-QA0830]
MLKIQEIRELIKLVDQSSIDEFVYENDGSKIKMKKAGSATVTTVQPVGQAAIPQMTAAIQMPPVAVDGQAAPVSGQQPTQETAKTESPAAETENLHKITSPMVGTFYASSSPDADVYVKPGSKVSKDTVVCIVEAMKLFNEIEAEINGEIVEVLAKNGQLVEYGQPLFLVRPE